MDACTSSAFIHPTSPFPTTRPERSARPKGEVPSKVRTVIVMQTQITARRSDLSDDLRTHIEEQLAKLQRFYDGIISAHVILDESNAPSGEKTAEINIDVYQKRLSADDAAPTHEQAVNQCADHIRRQLKRYKAKLRSTDKDAHR